MFVRNDVEPRSPLHERERLMRHPGIWTSVLDLMSRTPLTESLQVLRRGGRKRRTDSGFGGTIADVDASGDAATEPNHGGGGDGGDGDSNGNSVSNGNSDSDSGPSQGGRSGNEAASRAGSTRRKSAKTANPEDWEEPPTKRGCRWAPKRHLSCHALRLARNLLAKSTEKGVLVEIAQDTGLGSVMAAFHWVARAMSTHPRETWAGSLGHALLEHTTELLSTLRGARGKQPSELAQLAGFAPTDKGLADFAVATDGQGTGGGGQWHALWPRPAANVLAFLYHQARHLFPVASAQPLFHARRLPSLWLNCLSEAQCVPASSALSKLENSEQHQAALAIIAAAWPVHTSEMHMELQDATKWLRDEHAALEALPKGVSCRYALFTTAATAMDSDAVAEACVPVDGAVEMLKMASYASYASVAFVAYDAKQLEAPVAILGIAL